jgi:hypothetical protein
MLMIDVSSTFPMRYELMQKVQRPISSHHLETEDGNESMPKLTVVV